MSLQTSTGDQFLPNNWRLETRDSIDSTNAEAARRARAGEPGGYAIIAREQTAGRGRSGRAWSTGVNDLALSILLRPQLKPAAAAAAGFVAALAVYDLAREVLPSTAPLTIKWPNDVLIGDRKLSGILAEAASGADGRVDWLVLGMGINLATQSRDAAPHAIDLESSGGKRLQPEEAADRLLAHLDHWIGQWLTQGFEPIRDAWRDRARDLGKPVVARLPNETVEGVALDLGADGALVLQLADGAERRVSAGDVFPLARGS